MKTKTRKRRERPAEPSLIEENEFASACKSHIIAFATECYTFMGRGAVFINLAGVQLGETEAPWAALTALKVALHVPLDYLTENSQIIKDFEGWPDTELEQMVATYKPREEAVCVTIQGPPNDMSYCLLAT